MDYVEGFSKLAALRRKMSTDNETKRENKTALPDGAAQRCPLRPRWRRCDYILHNNNNNNNNNSSNDANDVCFLCAVSPN